MTLKLRLNITYLLKSKSHRRVCLGRSGIGSVPRYSCRSRRAFFVSQRVPVPRRWIEASPIAFVAVSGPTCEAIAIRVMKRFNHHPMSLWRSSAGCRKPPCDPSNSRIRRTRSFRGLANS